MSSATGQTANTNVPLVSNYTELTGNEFETNKRNQRGHQSKIWTSLPAIIVSFNSVAQTATVQPMIQSLMYNDDGTISHINLPQLIHCPVEFPSGGGVTITWQVVAGDECVVEFSSRCIDSWWQGGAAADSAGNKTQPRPQLDHRMHDLGDGIVRLGVRNQTRLLPNVSTVSCQIRDDLGTTYIDLNPTLQNVDIVTVNNVNVTATQGTININSQASTVNIVSAGNTNITAPLTNITGNVAVSGWIHSQGDMVAEGTSVHTHTHGGVQTGSGSTAAPN